LVVLKEAGRNVLAEAEVKPAGCIPKDIYLIKQ
jgi:hypothetical protein